MVNPTIKTIFVAKEHARYVLDKTLLYFQTTLLSFSVGKNCAQRQRLAIFLK